MGDYTWTDPNGYLWQGTVNESTSPPQIDATTTWWITAPSGEWQAGYCSDAIPASDANDASTALAAAYDKTGKQWYPVTADEQALMDNIGAASDAMLTFTQTGANVVLEAQAIVNALNEAAALAALLVFIPVVGTTIAAIGATVAGVDALKVEPAIQQVANLVMTGFHQTLDLASLKYDVQTHNVTLVDATTKLTEFGQNSVDSFWQVLSNVVTALP
jgi:hypothetical protein